MTENERQAVILRQLVNVCCSINEIWKESTHLEDIELRHLVMREAASTFYNFALLIHQVDSLINTEGGVFHA